MTNPFLVSARFRVLGLLLAMFSGCANKEYRVERIDNGQVVRIPLKFESMSGMRDGELVRAVPVFTDGMDEIRLDIHVRLGPPILFATGAYNAKIGNQTSEGPIVCDSFSFQGGQDALPSVGGTFRLQDNATGRTIFRVTMPATPITPKRIPE
ncbi:MAG TPA: hypothetical protein VGK48_14655 [Terriglobia bacterium]|jgi:hypothetical protein